MKRLLLCIVVALSATTLVSKTKYSMTVRDGGTGPYKAVIVEDSGLKGYSIFRPEDLAAACEAEGKLPVILFGNGGCSRNSYGLLDFLVEVASHGYVIVTNGQWRATDPALDHSEFTPKQKARYEKKMQRRAQKGQKRNVDDALDYFRALDYLQRQARRTGSEYYGRLDCVNVAVSGQSCGGLQALIMGTRRDPRVKSVVAVNSGVLDRGDLLDEMITRDALSALSTPVAYFIGGEEDIAYKNAVNDFNAITHVPVMLANCNSGHPGPYIEPDLYASIYLCWMDWQLKGKEVNWEKNTGWSIQTKNF